MICKRCIELGYKSSVTLEDEYKQFRVTGDSWNEDGKYIKKKGIDERVSKYSCSRGHDFEIVTELWTLWNILNLI